MTREDIIKLAREAGLVYWTHNRWFMDAGELGEEIERFAALVAAAERKSLMQLFTDPENQPTQHGTVTLEYMQRKIVAERKRADQEISMMSEHCAELILTEREACARAAELSVSADHCAAIIRARGRE